MKQYVGIDNSSSEHKVKGIDSKGRSLFSLTISNNLEGFNMLDTKLRLLSNVKIGFELAHGPLVDYLKYKKYRIFSLNPLKIKRFKEVVVTSGNKTDNIDALAIAEYLRSNQHSIREMKLNTSEVEKLKTLSVIHSRLAQNNARHLNKLRFAVRQYFPLHDTLFTSFGCMAQLKMIIKYPTYEDLKNASKKELQQFLLDNRYRKSSCIAKLLDKIKKYHQIISKDVEFAYKIEVNCLCNQLLVLNKSLKCLEQEMGKITSNHSIGKCFQTLPGAGKILSAKLLSLFGDNKNRFGSANDIQCLFGTAPKNYQSGNYHKVSMRKACNKSARSVLYRFAFSSMLFSVWARKYYDLQRERGKTNSVAVRALSNKWIKVIYSMWKNECVYDESKKM